MSEAGGPPCAVCGKPVPPQALAAARSRRHPYGGYSEDGQPLCYDHRRTRCEVCGKLVARSEITSRIVDWRKDRHLRAGMRPRVEAVMGSLCPDCNREHEEPSAPGDFSFLLVVMGVLVFGGVAVYLWLHVFRPGGP